MTVPGPPEIPASRRAARAMRDETIVPAQTRASRRTGTVPIEIVAATSDLLAPADSPTRARPPASAPVGPGGSSDDGSARRVARLFGSAPPFARHARKRRVGRLVTAVGLLIASVLIVGSTAAMTHVLATPSGDALAAPRQPARFVQEPPPMSGPSPTPAPATAPQEVDLCGDPAFATALAAGDDLAAITAAGGGETFRAAVAEGRAPCVDLGDPNRLWVVIDKIRPLVPQDFGPASLQYVAGLATPPTMTLRADAADALTVMAAASVAAGAGQLGLGSGFRSYDTQRETHDGQIAAAGEAAEASSARPGFSEHQSGLAADVIPCDAGGCGGLDALAASAQGAWVAANAAEYGWIVRYTEPGVPVTGYESEPWHLRYLGVELARAYVAGGWTSLEEFFGLPAAPDYLE